MKNSIICFILGLLVISCGDPKSIDNKDLLIPPQTTNWFDTLVVNYINKSDDELIKAAKLDSIPFDWTLDRTEVRNSTKYFVIQIAHTFEHRLIADKFLYIDSLSKSIYEYDLPNDRLIKWP